MEPIRSRDAIVASVKAKNSPFACAAPVLRAAAGQVFGWDTKVKLSKLQNEGTIDSRESGLPSSTTITSKRSRVYWRLARELRQATSVMYLK